MITAGFTRKKTSVLQRTEMTVFTSAEESTEIKSRENIAYETFSDRIPAGENVAYRTCGTSSSLNAIEEGEDVYEYVP